MNFSLFSAQSLTKVGNQRWSISDAPVCLTLLEKVFPRAASEIVSPVSQFAGGCLNYVLLRFRYYGSHFSVLSMNRMDRGFLSSEEYRCLEI